MGRVGGTEVTEEELGAEEGKVVLDGEKLGLCLNILSHTPPTDPMGGSHSPFSLSGLGDALPPLAPSNPHHNNHHNNGVEI